MIELEKVERNSKGLVVAGKVGECRVNPSVMDNYQTAKGLQWYRVGPVSFVKLYNQDGTRKLNEYGQPMYGYPPEYRQWVVEEKTKWRTLKTWLGVQNVRRSG